jgi:hypothetical protein
VRSSASETCVRNRLERRVFRVFGWLLRESVLAMLANRVTYKLQ